MGQTKSLQPKKIDRIRQKNLDFKNSISNRKKESSQSTSYIGPFKCNTKVNEFKWIQSPLSKLVLVWFCNFWRRVFEHFCCTSFATKKILEIIYFKVFHHKLYMISVLITIWRFYFCWFSEITCHLTTYLILLWINNICKKKTLTYFRDQVVPD